MAPVTILIVDKSGNIKETQLKSYVETDLYKKAGFKTIEDFKCQSQWNIDDLHGKSFYISVFGKTTGRANQENKYDFPPPIDSTLMFGSCVIINKTITGEAASISEDEWETVYDYLFGGFEDLGDKDSEDEEEDEEEEEEEEDDEFKSKSKKSKAKITAKPTGKGKKSKEPENIFIKTAETHENYLDCTSELSEEEYV